MSSPATFGPGQYLPAARATMYGRCLRSAAVSARAVRGMDAGVSDGRQQRHTPDAALRIHVRVGKLVLKTQTEEHASALNTSGRGSLLGTSDVRCGWFLSTKTGTMIEYSLGSCRGRKKVAQVPRSRRESRSESTERI